MKNTVFLLVFFMVVCQISKAQKSFKFYKKQDSIDYNHYRMIMTKGYQYTVIDGILRKELVDTTYQDSENFIGYDSASKLLREIPKFEYYIRKQNEQYTKGDQLKKTNRYDTITHLSFEGRDLKKLPVLKLLQCKNLKEIELVNTSVKKSLGY